MCKRTGLFLTKSKLAYVLAAISEENAAGTEETSANMQMLSTNIADCQDEAAKLTTISEELDAEISKFRY